MNRPDGLLLEHRHHDMMRPDVVLPRRLPHGAAYGHGADARIPGWPPTPDHAPRR